MKVFYLSLCRGLIHHYVKFEAESEEVVRAHAVEYFGKIWCSIYTEAYFMEIIRKRYPKSKVVNPHKPIILTGDNGEWE